MKWRKLLVIFLLFLIVWVSVAFYRANSAQKHAYQMVMSYPPAQRAKYIAHGETTPDDRVPLMPLLLNPFKPKPRAYLFSGDFLLAEVTY